MLQQTVFLSFALTLAAAAQAGDWPNWRGPQFNGSSTEQNLPEQWSQTDNVAWSVALPGAAASTPVISGSRVYLSGCDAAKDTLQAQCFDRATGKLLWQHDVAQGIQKDERSNFASSSPVTDGKLAFFFFGNGELACFDQDGTRRWAQNIQKEFGKFAFLWTFSSSPVLWEGRLYLQVLQRDTAVEGRGFTDRANESYLLALDPATGKTLWRVVRPSSAVAESRESFTTPMPFEFAGKKQLLVAGGDLLSGHDAETGKELWRWGTWNPTRVPHWRLVTSPVAGAGVILACGPKQSPIYAIKAGGEGTLRDDAIAWVSREARDVASDVPTPAFYDGDFFVLNDLRRRLSRIDPQTGKVKWSIVTPGQSKYEASPLAADGKLYLLNFDGEATVVKASTGEILRTIPMDQPRRGDVVRASIVAAHGQLFIRTTQKLFCIGPAR